ncbi:MAG: glutamine amidotransferase [Micrococcales bacterium]|nr:glutamine amidotransferase [Micrococcales bacterium]
MDKGSQLGIVHLFPMLMGTYGDGGNIKVLAYRAKARDIAVDVVTVGPGDQVPAGADLYVIGGGEDTGQLVAAEQLRQSTSFTKACDAGATIFAVCAGLQVLGHNFDVADGVSADGVGLLDVVTTRRPVRAVGEVLTEAMPGHGMSMLNGYENHAGATTLGPEAKPLAKVVSGIGNGAGGAAGDGLEGAVQGNVLATYMHGPVLARNPRLADWLLTKATGQELTPFEMPYTEELQAERLAYIKSGRLSAEAAITTTKPRRRP